MWSRIADFTFNFLCNKKFRICYPLLKCQSKGIVKYYVIPRHAHTEKDKNDWKNKCDKFAHQLSDYEAELCGLRRKCDIAETDNKKLRDTNQRLRDELNNCRKVSKLLIFE